MKLFIGGETGPWPDTLSGEINKQKRSIYLDTIKPLEEYLSGRNYGDGLTDLAVIQMILRPDIALYKERMLYRAKQATADYRLKIEYDAFINADEVGKKKLMIENILQCVRLLGEKQKSKKWNLMQKDLKKIL